MEILITYISPHMTRTFCFRDLKPPISVFAIYISRTSHSVDRRFTRQFSRINLLVVFIRPPVNGVQTMLQIQDQTSVLYFLTFFIYSVYLAKLSTWEHWRYVGENRNDSSVRRMGCRILMIISLFLEVASLTNLRLSLKTPCSHSSSLHIWWNFGNCEQVILCLIHTTFCIFLVHYANIWAIE